VFTPEELEQIHLATLEVLSRTGVFVEDDEALAIFEGGRAAVDHDRHVVRLAPRIAEEAVRSAQPKVVMCGRRKEDGVVLEDGNVDFTNFGEGMQVVDLYTGEPHES
jgi:trimethylamine---corrinoid protein Co-methyltransferase